MATFVAGPNIPRPRDFIFGDSPLDVYRDTIQAGLALRKAREPSVAEQKAKQQAIDWVKFRVSKFTEMITNPDIDSASRDHIKMMALEFHGSLPPMFKKAVEPILAYSPLDPVAQGMERFERLNPRPIKPYAMKQVGSAPTGYPGPSGSDPGAGTWTEVRDQGNRSAFAEYDWAMAEWRMRREMMKNKLLGLDQKSPNLKMPRLMHTDDPNVFSYKDDVTQGIGLIDLGKVPKGEVTKAIDEFGDTWPDIIHNGFYRTSEPARVEVGGNLQEVTIVRDLLKGNKYIQSVPIGPKASAGKRKLPDEDFQNGIAGANIGAKPKDGKNQQQSEIIQRLREIKSADWTGEAQGLLKEYNEELVPRYGYTVIPHNPEVKKNWFGFLPGVNVVSMEGGTWMAVPVDETGIVQFTDRNGKTGNFFYNSEAGMAVDADGGLVEATKGVQPGGVVDDVFEVGVAETPSLETEGKKVKVGDVLVGAVESLSRKEVIAGTDKAERLVAGMSRKYGDTEIPGKQFWKDVKVIARELKIADEFLGDWIEEMFVRIPRRAIDKFLEMEIEVEK